MCRVLRFARVGEGESMWPWGVLTVCLRPGGVVQVAFVSPWSEWLWSFRKDKPSLFRAFFGWSWRGWLMRDFQFHNGYLEEP